MMETLTLFLVVLAAVQIVIDLVKLFVNLIEAMKNKKKK